MWKIMLVHPEIMDSEQPTWEIIKLIIQAQYSITALGIIVLIAIAVILIGINLIVVQRKVNRSISRIRSEMGGIKMKMEKLKEETAQNTNGEIQRLKESTRIEIQLLKGDRDRVIVSLFMAQQMWENVVVWSGCGVEDYALANETTRRDGMIEVLISSLKKSNYILERNRSNLLARIKYIPRELQDKKEKIRELINKFPKKED